MRPRSVSPSKLPWVLAGNFASTKIFFSSFDQRARSCRSAASLRPMSSPARAIFLPRRLGQRARFASPFAVTFSLMSSSSRACSNFLLTSLSCRSCASSHELAPLLASTFLAASDHPCAICTTATRSASSMSNPGTLARQAACKAFLSPMPPPCRVPNLATLHPPAAKASAHCSPRPAHLNKCRRSSITAKLDPTRA